MHPLLLTIATRQLGDTDAYLAARDPELTFRERRALIKGYFSGFREAGIRRSGDRYDAAKHLARFQLMCTAAPVAELIAELEVVAPLHKIGRSALYDSRKEAIRFLKSLGKAPPELQIAFFIEEFGESFAEILGECFTTAGYEVPDTDGVWPPEWDVLVEHLVNSVTTLTTEQAEQELLKRLEDEEKLDKALSQD